MVLQILSMEQFRQRQEIVVLPENVNVIGVTEFEAKGDL